MPIKQLRDKDNLSILPKEESNGQWQVYLIKDETWAFEILFFEWDETVKSWFVSGYDSDTERFDECN